jgi:hypothetical protein
MDKVNVVLRKHTKADNGHESTQVAIEVGAGKPVVAYPELALLKAHTDGDRAQVVASVEPYTTKAGNKRAILRIEKWAKPIYVNSEKVCAQILS